jgi:Ser/Thr protein kinase RdoA (MazF antagonist)
MDIEVLDPLAAWDFPDEAIVGSVESGGLINETWGVALPDGTPVAVLQRLNTAIFDPSVHLDIWAITQRLVERGRHTPELIPTRDGLLWHEDLTGGIWRCLTWVGTRTVQRFATPAEAHSAGRLVARFHGALLDLHHDFHFERPGAHDTTAHMAHLQEVLVTHRNHRLRRHVAPLADALWELWQGWDGPADLPRRILHNDLKVSNVRFVGDEAVALIDLDTLGWGTLDAELGDALRSWCNPHPEDHPTPRFDLELFTAAMSGYVQVGRNLPLERAEWRSIVPGALRITLELASRFAADALEESYFAWEGRYPSAGDHHLARARSMLELAWSLDEVADEAEERLEALLRGEDPSGAAGG